VDESVVYPLLLSEGWLVVKTLSQRSVPFPQGESYHEPSELRELPLLALWVASTGPLRQLLRDSSTSGSFRALVNSTLRLPSSRKRTLGLLLLSLSSELGLLRGAWRPPVCCLQPTKKPFPWNKRLSWWLSAHILSLDLPLMQS